ncbi:MAG: HAMP domain-containing histidine kinase [Kiritimatiellae bacterium]|nr:HAMP domain-containing histidine kinase [Kiritimatiellia bacterium]
MPRRKDIIAIVGAGKGGRYILETLLRMKDIEVRYVYDSDPNAPGMLLAKENKIFCSTDTTYPELWGNRKISIILEVTGSAAVFRSLGGLKAQSTSLIGARGNRMVFGMLASENQVRRDLEHYKDKLEHLVTQRTSELEQANKQLNNRLEELAQLNRKLEDISQQKTQYLLRSTHQLKAPFAAIQSYTDLILRGYTGEIPEKTCDITNKIKQRCDTLSTAIREMLHLANLQVLTASELDIETVDLNALVNKTVEETNILAESGNITLTFTPASTPVKIQCDPAKLTGLLQILISNAIDYSPAHSKVVVSIRSTKTRISIQVKDKGIGIRDDAREKIFSEFYRTNEAAEKNPNGSGLGLPIAGHIARLHGFKINLNSTEGKGSTFSVRIPIKNSKGS